LEITYVIIGDETKMTEISKKGWFPIVIVKHREAALKEMSGVERKLESWDSVVASPGAPGTTNSTIFFFPFFFSFFFFLLL
jgi:hypothetical protein